MNLQYNSIGAEGVKWIAEALKVNQTLSTLDLSQNEIGSDGAEWLAEAEVWRSELTLRAKTTIYEGGYPFVLAGLIVSYLDFSISLPGLR